jgi:hypothetical protein
VQQVVDDGTQGPQRVPRVLADLRQGDPGGDRAEQPVVDGQVLGGGRHLLGLDQAGHHAHAPPVGPDEAERDRPARAGVGDRGPPQPGRPGLDRRALVEHGPGEDVGDGVPGDRGGVQEPGAVAPGLGDEEALGEPPGLEVPDRLQRPGPGQVVRPGHPPRLLGRRHGRPRRALEQVAAGEHRPRAHRAHGPHRAVGVLLAGVPVPWLGAQREPAVDAVQERRRGRVRHRPRPLHDGLADRERQGRAGLLGCERTRMRQQPGVDLAEDQHGRHFRSGGSGRATRARGAR